MSTIKPISIKWHRQSGTSLIEVMLACVLASLLIEGCLQMYLATQKTFALQQAIIFLQENVRFASHFLTTNIQMAGYAACDTTSPLTPSNLAIQGFRDTLPSELQNKVVKGTDGMVIGRCELQNGKSVFQQLAFFIGTTNRKNILGKPVYALYVNPLGSDKSELVSNVDNMQLSYGIADASGENIAQYLSADQVQNWNQVRSVEIALLLSSQTPVLAQAETYEFGGKLFPKDRFLHREWRIYAALRNQNHDR